MTEAYSEAPRRLVALSLVHELDEARAEELGLLVTQRTFNRWSLQRCLKYQDALQERLQPVVAEYWLDPRNTCVVATGRHLFTSRQPLDSVNTMPFDEFPYFHTIVRRSDTLAPQPRTRWLEAVPNLK